MKNYIEIDRKSLFYKHYVYVDTKEYLADAIFEQAKLKVFFTKTGKKPDCRYLFVICKVKKKDSKKFIAAMDQLYKKMLLLGYGDFGKLLEGIEG